MTQRDRNLEELIAIERRLRDRAKTRGDRRAEGIHQANLVHFVAARSPERVRHLTQQPGI